FVSSQYLSVKSSRIAPADSAAASIGSTFFSTSARRSVQSAGDLSRRHLFGSTAKSGLSTRVTIGAPFASLQAATYPCDTSAAVELGLEVRLPLGAGVCERDTRAAGERGVPGARSLEIRRQRPAVLVGERDHDVEVLIGVAVADEGDPRSIR